jgi:hypothetical protein
VQKNTKHYLYLNSKTTPKHKKNYVIQAKERFTMSIAAIPSISLVLDFPNCKYWRRR